jgi:hypothetical protein
MSLRRLLSSSICTCADRSISSLPLDFCTHASAASDIDSW